MPRRNREARDKSPGTARYAPEVLANAFRRRSRGKLSNTGKKYHVFQQIIKLPVQLEQVKLNALQFFFSPNFTLKGRDRPLQKM